MNPARWAAAVAAEFTRAASRRATPGLLVGALVLVAVSVLGSAVSETRDLAAGSTIGDATLRRCIGQAFTVFLFSSLCGAQTVTRQLRDGLTSFLFLARPSWSYILTVKAVAASLLGAVFGLAAAVVALTVARARLDRAGALEPMSSRVWWLLAGIVLLGAAGGAWGVFVGAVFRHHALTLAGLVVWSVGLEGGLIALVPAVGRWLPGGAQAAVVADPTLSGRFGPAGGVTLLVAWLAIAGLLALHSLRRRPLVAAG